MGSFAGTDASGMDPDSAEGGTHPRAYSTYPRILGRGVREEGIYADVVVFESGSSTAPPTGTRTSCRRA